MDPSRSGSDEKFPQVYGKIDLDAIVEAFDIELSKDGLFYENDKLKKVIEATVCLDN